MSVQVQLQPNIDDYLPKQAHVRAAIKRWKIPGSIWDSLCHPRADEVIEEVDSYFLQHWNFPHEKAKKTFIDAGFSRVTSLYFPKALDNRIHFACRLLTVLFLIDGSLHFPIPLALSCGSCGCASLRLLHTHFFPCSFVMLPPSNEVPNNETPTDVKFRYSRGYVIRGRRGIQ